MGALRLLVVPFGLIGFLGAARPATAEPPAPAARNGALIGGLHGGGYVFGSGAAGHSQNLGSGPVIGVRGGLHVTPRLRLEVDIAQVFTSVDQVNAKTRAGAFVSVIPVLAAVRYDILPDARVIPFAKAGLGAIWFLHSDLDSAARFAACWGIGAQYFLAHWIGLRADLAQVLYFGSSPVVEHEASATFNLAATVGVEVLVGAAPTNRAAIPAPHDPSPSAAPAP